MSEQKSESPAVYHLSRADVNGGRPASFLIEDMLSAEIIQAEEIDWIDRGCPFRHGELDKQNRSRDIADLVAAAWAAGTLPLAPEPERSFIAGAPYAISDYIGDGINGIKSHADGKMYDSKSAYYKSVKEAGCFIAEGGSERAAHKPKSEPSMNDIKRDIAQSIQQTGG